VASVYKTHALPAEFPADPPIKFVFVFGRPSDIVVSLLAVKSELGDQWFARHFRHMRGDGDPNDLLEKDVFGIERQIRCWTNAEGLDLLCIKYEALWRCADAIASHLGVGFKLARFQERKSRHAVPVELIARTRQNYSAADAAYEELDELIVKRKPAPPATES